MPESNLIAWAMVRWKFLSTSRYTSQSQVISHYHLPTNCSAICHQLGTRYASRILQTQPFHCERLPVLSTYMPINNGTSKKIGNIDRSTEVRSKQDCEETSVRKVWKVWNRGSG